MDLLIKELFNNIRTNHEDIYYYLDLIKSIGSDEIHFGYWSNPKKLCPSNLEFAKAQSNLSNLVISLINKEFKSVLDIGGGIGSLSNKLFNLRYDPLCIVPDNKLIKIGKNKFPNIKFLKSSAEFFKINNTFDLAILFESFQYFTKKDLALKNIYSHLKVGGKLIILDEFDKNNKDLLNEPLLIEFMDKIGYKLNKNFDISKNILPTCDFIINYYLRDNKEMTKMWKLKRIAYINKTLNYRILVFDKI